MLICKLCQKTFDGIPSDAVPVSQRRQGGYQLFQFKNGELHDLREVRAPVLTLEQLSARAKRGAHTRRHRNVGIQKENCAFCFPSQPITNYTAQSATEK
jgi:hypothetical protein